MSEAPFVDASSHTANEIASCLRGGDAVPAGPRDVSVIETHMSWVFLTDGDVYKLKKAIRHDGFDVRTPDLRRRNCLEEVRLNRRLAPDVYRGVVAVTREASGSLALDGRGEPIDWLVHMRRLPANDNLDAVLQAGRAADEESAIRRAARLLARFYADSVGVPLAGPMYWARLEAGVRLDREVLRRPRYGLPSAKIEALATAQLATLDTCRGLFEQRAEGGRIVEGHGDLRPEHIWLTDPPVVIDCVEFDRSLRIVDPLDDLSFLALECERLGQPRVGRWFLEAYVDATGDSPPEVVRGFYRVYRALRRATLAAQHLDDPAVTDPARFLRRAAAYLEMVDPVVPDAVR